jgi:mannose-6-phosphate isomerase-like protein (cupin superfamily)
MGAAVKVTQWTGSDPPTRGGLWQLMSDEGLLPYAWSNGPFDIYAAHTHGYDKVIYVVSGAITFGLHAQKSELSLQPGDRLDLPKGVVHDARVGPDGVTCLEAHY